MKSVTPYLTAEALSIAQWEHDGLVALVGPLSRDQLRIGMSSASTFDSCGTAHCIGGWIAAHKNVHVAHYVSSGASPALHSLFYPGGAVYEDECLLFVGGFVANDLRHAGWDATAPQAARAIVNFLMTGDPQWDRVMREDDLSAEARDTLDALNAIYVADFDADDSGARTHVVEPEGV